MTENRSVNVQLRIPPDLRDQLDERAEQVGGTRSSIARALVEQGLRGEAPGLDDEAAAGPPPWLANEDLDTGERDGAYEKLAVGLYRRYPELFGDLRADWLTLKSARTLIASLAYWRSRINHAGPGANPNDELVWQHEVRAAFVQLDLASSTKVGSFFE